MWTNSRLFSLDKIGRLLHLIFQLQIVYYIQFLQAKYKSKKKKKNLIKFLGYLTGFLIASILSIEFLFERSMCDSPNCCVHNARWLKTVRNNYKDLTEWDKPLYSLWHEWLGSKRLQPTGSRILCGVFEGSRFIRQSYSVSVFPLKLMLCN